MTPPSSPAFRFEVQVAASTSAGMGKFSPPVLVETGSFREPRSGGFVSSIGFIVLVACCSCSWWCALSWPFAWPVTSAQRERQRGDITVSRASMHCLAWPHERKGGRVRAGRDGEWHVVAVITYCKFCGFMGKPHLKPMPTQLSVLYFWLSHM